MNKKLIFGLYALMIIAGIFVIGSVNVGSIEVSYCCEKTTTGAWCQNSPEANCNPSYRSTPSSCESTSYCKLGTCYNSQEGTCMENTPQKVCEENNGVWSDQEVDDVPQCQLGCCTLGDQAAFVTPTRCKQLSSLYGLQTDFSKNIQNEIQCILSVSSEEKGACVFEEEFERTCRFITQKECNELSYETKEFRKGFLCSDESLGTECGPSENTICIEGKDEVYFVDTCGNIANIYDASRQNDPIYWSKVFDKSETCNPDSNNANSASCGNCDYFLGSTCKAYQRNQDTNPTYGDYVCRDLSCEYEGEKYQHGETWCADSKGIEDSLPGSRAFRLVCYSGDVTVEPCDDYRNQVCIQGEVNGFSNAACRENKWQNCLAQENKKDCENEDQRDCEWIPGETLNSEADEQGTCVPQDSPGLQGEEAGQLCLQASKTCTVVFEKGLIGDKKCVENCECLDESWKVKMNQMCVSLGDCGVKVNYVGTEGYNTLEDLFQTSDGDDEDEEDKANE